MIQITTTDTGYRFTLLENGLPVESGPAPTEAAALKAAREAQDFMCFNTPSLEADLRRLGLA